MADQLKRLVPFGKHLVFERPSRREPRLKSQWFAAVRPNGFFERPDAAACRPEGNAHRGQDVAGVLGRREEFSA